MTDGFVKVAAATPDIRVADPAHNAGEIIALAKTAAASGAAVIVFPELCVTAYTCGDLFLQDSLLLAALKAIENIAQSTQDLNSLIIVGVPLRQRGKLYNAAAVINRGSVIGVAPKSYIPNYSEFYELRHFTPAPSDNSFVSIAGKDVPFGKKLIFACEQLPDLRVGIEICEDLWVPASPGEELCRSGATIICNPSASDETVGKREYRRMLVQSASGRLVCGYVYASAGAGESSTDLIFSSHNLIAENGAILKETSLFEGGVTISDIDLNRLSYDRRRMNTFVRADAACTEIPFSLNVTQTALTRAVEKHPFVPDERGDRSQRAETIFTLQSLGLRQRVKHTVASSVVVGVSGGLDSTLALLVAARAMDLLGRPRSDIAAVTMPCFGTTRRTRGNAETLSAALGASFTEIDITEAVNRHFTDIGHDKTVTDVTFENSQARERTQVLMDLANKHGGLVVGTGDMSELALGWATYNGDHMSMYGVNASVPKTLVRHIVRHVADTWGSAELEKVLTDILDTPVSPELLPHIDGDISQKTEDIVGPYELHDFFLYYMIRWGFRPAKIFRLALMAFEGEYDRDTILKWLRVFYRRFFAQQFKRSCLPDGPKVGSVTLSPRGDWRMPSDACAALWLDEIDKL